MQVVILAGGLGTRLKPLTEKVPKAMIDIGGRPFLDYQAKYFFSQGASELLLLTGHKSEMIESFVNTQEWRTKVKILSEGENLRGTGGALTFAADKMQDNFVLVYGDSFLPISVAPIYDSFLKSGMPALMTVLKNQNDWDQSNVIFRQGRVELYSKNLSPKPPEMIYIDYGLSVFKKALIQSWKHQAYPEKFDLSDRQSELSQEGKLAGFEVKDRFYEIGSFQGLSDFERLVSSPPWREFFDKK